MMTTTPIAESVELESRPEACDYICQRIQPQLVANHYSPNDIFAVNLALREAVQNAIEHGNQLDPDKRVQVDYKIDEERVEIDVIDQGVGFSPDNLPDKRAGSDLCTPNGRGVLLIRAYMDIVAYNERGNAVHMVRDKQPSEITNQHLPAA